MGGRSRAVKNEDFKNGIAMHVQETHIPSIGRKQNPWEGGHLGKKYGS